MVSDISDHVSIDRVRADAAHWSTQDFLTSNVAAMTAFRTFLLVGLAAILCASCGHNKHATKTVTTRASFDFDCPPEDLKLTVLDTEGARNLSSQIGVEGCGKKGVYVYLASTDTWISNAGVTPEMAQQEAEFKEEQEKANDAALQPPVDVQSNYQRGVEE